MASATLISWGHCILAWPTRTFLAHLVLCHQQIWSLLKLHQRKTQQRRCEAAAHQTERQQFLVSIMKRASVNAAIQNSQTLFENQYKFYSCNRCSTPARTVIQFVPKKACIVNKIFPKTCTTLSKLCCWKRNTCKKPNRYKRAFLIRPSYLSTLFFETDIPFLCPKS